MNINNRWFQLVSSLLAMIMIANLQYSWTLFVGPMQTSTGWKLSDIQFAFTLFILFQTWIQPLDGWLIDRLGPRWFISADRCQVLTDLGGGRTRYFTTDVFTGIGVGLHEPHGIRDRSGRFVSDR